MLRAIASSTLLLSAAGVAADAPEAPAFVKELIAQSNAQAKRFEATLKRAQKEFRGQFDSKKRQLMKSSSSDSNDEKQNKRELSTAKIGDAMLFINELHEYNGFGYVISMADQFGYADMLKMAVQCQQSIPMSVAFGGNFPPCPQCSSDPKEYQFNTQHIIAPKPYDSTTDIKVEFFTDSACTTLHPDYANVAKPDISNPTDWSSCDAVWNLSPKIGGAFYHTLTYPGDGCLSEERKASLACPRINDNYDWKKCCGLAADKLPETLAEFESCKPFDSTTNEGILAAYSNAKRMKDTTSGNLTYFAMDNDFYSQCGSTGSCNGNDNNNDNIPDNAMSCVNGFQDATCKDKCDRVTSSSANFAESHPNGYGGVSTTDTCFASGTNNDGTPQYAKVTMPSPAPEKKDSASDAASLSTGVAALTFASFVALLR